MPLDYEDAEDRRRAAEDVKHLGAVLREPNVTPFGTVSGETRVTDPTSGAQKGQKLERFDLIPVPALQELARVYGMGAQKYAERNWEKGYAWSLSYAALQRHLNAFWNGEERDPESGLSHLAHAAFHVFALLTYAGPAPPVGSGVFTGTNRGKDDRPTTLSKPESPAAIARRTNLAAYGILA